MAARSLPGVGTRHAVPRRRCLGVTLLQSCTQRLIPPFRIRRRQRDAASESRAGALMALHRVSRLVSMTIPWSVVAQQASQGLPLKCRVFGRDERRSAFPRAFAPHPPAPFSHKGRRGSLGVLMAEMGDGTQLNAPGNGSPHTMTEIHFGLRSAESVRLVRYSGQEQWSIYLRTAINAQSP